MTREIFRFIFINQKFSFRITHVLARDLQQIHTYQKFGEKEHERLTDTTDLSIVTSVASHPLQAVILKLLICKLVSKPKLTSENSLNVTRSNLILELRLSAKVLSNRTRIYESYSDLFL